MLFVCFACRIRCDFTCNSAAIQIFVCFSQCDFRRYFFLLFLILANCVRDESSADSSNGSEECGTYRFLCTQMKILQLILEFGYIFCLFSQKHDRKGSSKKMVVYIIRKTVVCILIIYRTYVESTLSIIICRYRIRDFAWCANFLYAHALKWTVSR